MSFIGKYLTAEIADNGVAIYSSVWELFKLEFSVHGAEQRLLVCLYFVSINANDTPGQRAL